MEALDMIREDGSVNILQVLILALPEYYRLTKSEELAKEELGYYDKEYNDKLAERKKPYEDLIAYADKCGIAVPEQAYGYEVTTADVLARLDEQMMIEIEDIEETATKALEVKYDQELVEDTYWAIDTVRDEYERIKDNYISKKARQTLKRVKQN